MPDAPAPTPNTTCPHPSLDDMWDNDANDWATRCDQLCDDCLQALHDATCMCDSAVSHATRDDTNVPLPDVVGRADIIAHIHGSTIDDANPVMSTYTLSHNGNVFHTWEDEDMALAIETAILYLNSHLCPPEYRRDDEEPEVDCISNSITELTFGTRRAHVIFTVRET